ncbi:Centromere protein I [Papilio xuthus]|uniref:Centromere protein I n=1 Tax=Papilio xuthus TaxID=66420 RepID=A0A194PMS0_PAPXU|nr:Centromere protein I [Papilio xuthus]
MTDVEDIIHYIKSLRKGFDKDLFQSKIDELAYIVENEGLEFNDFHTLFKVWLNLSIPITKWINLGACLVPNEKIGKLTVDYALRWLLAKYDNQSNFSNISFLLDWLTAAMDCNSVELDALNIGYEVFYSTLTYEALAPHSIKLVYNLTKPSDVTRRRVVELLDCAKKREAKKNLYRQIQVLLGLFKSYRPECVPEDIPSISIHTSFRKINANLLNRFTLSQDSGRNKKDPLIPNMEFLKLGSMQYTEQVTQKTYLDFSSPVSLLKHSVSRPSSRPARLRALLCNDTGTILLALASDTEQAFFSHDLHHLLNHCFFDKSPYSYEEKQYLLHRLATFQRTILQGIPVVTRFLAQFIAFWNETDFFGEIMDLVEWLSTDCYEYIESIMTSLTKIYSRAHSMDQCVMLKSLSAMYANLVHTSVRDRRLFMSTNSPRIEYSQILRGVATLLTQLYRKIFSKLKNKQNNGIKNTHEFEHRQLLKAYTSDVISCLYQENFLSNREEGYVFSKLNKQTVAMLNKIIPNAESKFSLRNHLAFAPYTYMQIEGSQAEAADNSMWFKYAIDKQFPSLCKLLIMTTPQLVT